MANATQDCQLPSLNLIEGKIMKVDFLKVLWRQVKIIQYVNNEAQ